MNLFIFPAIASFSGGYEIAVYHAYKKLKPKEEDVVIWYTNSTEIPFLREQDIVLPQASLKSIKNIKNILSGRFSKELSVNDLIFLKKYDFNNIHCDEVVFYRALRTLFPDKLINVRFHNCFSRILHRKELLNIKLDFRFWLKMKVLAMLERKIFRDKNIYKIFLSDEDRDYYKANIGNNYDSEVWSFKIDLEKMNANRKNYVLKNKIVWFGGIESHKKKSVEWFVTKVFPEIKNHYPKMEFHLYGRGTEDFNLPQKSIFGHGFYLKEDFPFSTEALYINPDLIGGGVKLKLSTYLEEGIPFISTPFGFEGYKKELRDDKYCFVEEDSNWVEKIISIFDVDLN
ncbi:hypothetical protein SAMN05444411_101776 [Lutibacter oricola]|uniref:Uncharacterized protein n=1 Tax=Lutibacter oricola TaxID=762486 RepID=A0A1H2TQH1_9FLAO|nr:glycosyltransferase [Lutibacter oricola]SDW46047.1 hypothetical protein SAMN05444411_101776 [Lutibacter oricola]